MLKTNFIPYILLVYPNTVAYDSKGNITSCYILNEGEIVAGYLYTYDEAGQLVREDNSLTGLSYVYVYDKGGNIAQRIEYEATDGELGEPLTTVSYTYDSAWKDKLVSYGGTAISTDSIGNPLNYIGRNYEGGDINGTLEWDGRQLASVTLDGARYEYEYNSEGLRTQMTIYNSNNEAENIFYYIWQGGKLQGYFVSDGSGNALYSIKLLYDNGGEAAGYEVLVAEDNSRKTYIFHKNLQGDIAGIFNEQGEVLLTFTYDAWGNISTDFNAGNLENIEEAFILILTIPLTYRGYMYDIFTGLYYLQSRYYNPVYGRFLNADTTDILEATQGTTHGANLFAYCNNNPVNMVDPEGCEPISLALLGAIFGAIAIILIFIIAIYHLNIRTENNNDKIENAYKLIEKFKKFHDLGEDYWLAFYYHAKNVVEFGTNVNKNPTFPYFELFGFPHSYKHFCSEAYMYLQSFLVSSNEKWAEMSCERRIEIMNNMAWYDVVMYNNIITYFAGSFYEWGVDTYEVLWGIIKDMGTL